MIRLAIMGSTRGTILPDLIKGLDQKNAKIEIVISDKKDALILEKARIHNISTEFVDPLSLSGGNYDKKISDILKKSKLDLIVLIGYMRILSNEFVKEWKNKIINVHPSLLPAFAGMMNKQVHEAVLKSGATETGCTVHYVTEEVDAGPILCQKKCMVVSTDSIETLKSRVQKLESEALIEVIQNHHC